MKRSPALPSLAPNSKTKGVPKKAAPPQAAPEQTPPVKVAPAKPKAKSAPAVAKAAPAQADRKAPVKAVEKKDVPNAKPVKTVAKAAPSKAVPKPVAPRKRSSQLELYVARSGPKRGDAQLEAAFRTRVEAVAFLSNVHGLAHDEQKLLAREGKLSLDPRWHGSETCAIRAVKFPPQDVPRALNGDLYL